MDGALFVPAVINKVNGKYGLDKNGLHGLHDNLK